MQVCFPLDASIFGRGEFTISTRSLFPTSCFPPSFPEFLTAAGACFSARKPHIRLPQIHLPSPMYNSEICPSVFGDGCRNSEVHIFAKTRLKLVSALIIYFLLRRKQCVIQVIGQSVRGQLNYMAIGAFLLDKFLVKE